MTAETVTIQVPQPLFDRLERLARLTRRPIETLIAQSLSVSLPLLPDDLPAGQRDALLALEDLNDAELWQVERATFPDEDYRQLTTLRERQREGDLSVSERNTLARLSEAADLLTLEKAYAAVLLKWRGLNLPPLADATTS